MVPTFIDQVLFGPLAEPWPPQTPNPTQGGKGQFITSSKRKTRHKPNQPKPKGPHQLWSHRRKPDHYKDPRPWGGPPPARAHHYQPPQLKQGQGWFGRGYQHLLIRYCWGAPFDLPIDAGTSNAKTGRIIRVESCGNHAGRLQ